MKIRKVKNALLLILYLEKRKKVCNEKEEVETILSTDSKTE